MPRLPDRLGQPPTTADRSLDRPIRALVRVLDEMDSRRVGAEQKLDYLQDEWAAYNYNGIKRKRYYIASLIFECSLRAVDGSVLDTSRHMVSLGLAKRPGFLMVRSGRKQRWRVPFEELRDPAGYQSFLESLWARHGLVSLRLPKQQTYLVDLYYQSGLVRPELDEKFGLVETVEDYALLRHFFKYRCREQLGATFVYQDHGRRRECRNGYLKYLAATDESLLHAMAAKGRPRTNALETVADQAPADVGALELLVAAYLDEERNQAAFDLLTQRRILVEHSGFLARTYARLQAERIRYKENLLARKADFVVDKTATVSVLAPAPFDYVGGPTDIFFTVAGATSPLLRSELAIDGETRQQLDGPPFRFNLDMSGLKRDPQLRIRAYFENETYAQTFLPVRVIALNNQECIQLISLRTVVTKGRHKFLANLRQQDFRLLENGVERPISGFVKDRAPLRIALLMDTSSSMTGAKLYQAQYAVNRFLNCLSPHDKAEVYTFDKRVLKLPGPFNGFDAPDPMLFTLRPQYATALNDALAVACTDLAEEKGTRVIIVVSDGSDSASTIGADQLLPLLSKAGIPVYSIILGDDHGLDRQGARFLQKISHLTGSITTLVDDVTRLEQTFVHIHDELKSFYFIDFYSQQAAFDMAAVDVAVRGLRTQARFYQHLTPAELQVDPNFGEGYLLPTIVENGDQ